MHILMSKMQAVKHWLSNEETESRIGVQNQISMTENISETVDVYHKDKPVRK